MWLFPDSTRSTFWAWNSGTRYCRTTVELEFAVDELYAGRWIATMRHPLP